MNNDKPITNLQNITPKNWLAPRFTVFGDIKELTKNTGNSGTGDIKSEAPSACRSPGACS